MCQGLAGVSAAAFVLSGGGVFAVPASCCGLSLAALSISAVLAVSCPVALPVFGASLVSCLATLSAAPPSAALADSLSSVALSVSATLASFSAGLSLPASPEAIAAALAAPSVAGSRVVCAASAGAAAGSVFSAGGRRRLAWRRVKSANSFCQSSWPSFSRAAQASRPWLRTSPSTTSCLARSRVVAATSRLASLASGLPWGELMLKSASFSAALSSSSWVSWTGPGDSRWRG